MQKVQKETADSTATIPDLIKAYSSVKGDLETLAEVNTDPVIKAGATSAAVNAGHIRVALTQQTNVDDTDLTGLHNSVNALDAACVANGK